MTQENKELLLKDLCARLPYGIQIHIDFNENGHIVADATLNTITSITGQFFNFTDIKQDFKNGDCCPIGGFGSNKLLRLEEFKPYLRPMSSMTEKERKEFSIFIGKTETYVQQIRLDADSIANPIIGGFQCVYWGLFDECIDWLNKKMFDYRGLIGKGLALEATEGMYNLA